MGYSSARLRLEAVRNWPALAVQANYHANTIAKLVDLDPRSLRKFIHEKIGIATQQWLNCLRQFEAEKLVRAGGRSKEMAETLGYKSSTIFCRRFKKGHDESQRKWRATKHANLTSAAQVAIFRAAGFWPE